MSKERRNYILLTITIFTGFLFFGFSENIKGPAIPFIQSEFALSEMELGLLLSLNSLAYLLACAFTAALARKTGLKLAISISLVGMAASGVIFLLCQNFPTVIAAYFIVYLGNGMLEITLGILAAKIFTKSTGMMMNLTHFFYGLSSTVAPMAATYLISTTVAGWALGWKGMYFIMLIGCVIPVFFAIPARFPTVSNTENGEKSITTKEYVRDPVLMITVFLLSCGVMAELSTGSWFVNYMQKARGFTNNEASLYLTLFFVFFTLARLLFGPLTEKVGYARWISIVALFACVVTVIGLFIPGAFGAVVMSMSGLGVATIYPTVMAILARRYQSRIDGVMTITLTIMGVMSMIGNFLVGAITDMFCKMFGTAGGYVAGFLFIAVCALACSFGAEILRRKIKE